jgi:Zn-dependent M16 (insulinase) family peptidase
MELSLHFLILIIVMSNAAKVHQEVDKLLAMNLEHILKVQKFKCKQPQPRLIPVEELFTVNSEDLYTPRATVLHRCGEDTGCCPTEGLTCVPHEMEIVTLMFSVHDTQYHNKSRQELKVANHTLCQCAELLVE